MFGFHVSREWKKGKRPTLREQVVEARERLGFSRLPFAFQVFLAGPRHMKFTAEVPEAHDLSDYIKSQNAAGYPTWGVAHGAYPDMPWNAESPKHKWTLKWMSMEFERTASAGLAGMVIHLGTTSHAKVLEILPKLLPVPFRDRVIALRGGGNDVEPAVVPDPSVPRWDCHFKNEASCRPSHPPHSEDPPGGRPNCVRLFLETPCVLPKNSHYESPAKLRALFSAIRQNIDPYLLYFGLCIDTAHIWGCGIDISSHEAASTWIEALESCHDIIPPHAIMLHLNDSVYGLGSGRDEHECLFMGRIWEDYAMTPERSGLAVFLDYAHRFNIPVVLERKARGGGSDEHTTELALKADVAAIAQLLPETT